MTSISFNPKNFSPFPEYLQQAVIRPLAKADFSCRGEAFADENPDFTNKFERKCFALLGFRQEVYCLAPAKVKTFIKVDADNKTISF